MSTMYPNHLAHRTADQAASVAVNVARSWPFGATIRGVLGKQDAEEGFSREVEATR